jgi:DNA-binding PadR family transcriptional regulator
MRHGCPGRRHGGGHFGRFGSRFGDGGFGRHGLWSARKLGAADLQLVILALLAEQPRHGYEIIKALEQTSKGFYSPSPGMVYPALTYLEEVGEATVEAEGTRKLYRITDAGRARLDAHRDFIETLLAELSRMGNRMEKMREAFARDEAPEDVGHAAVDRARRELRAALIAKLSAAPSSDELARVAEVLKRATEELRNK